MELFDLGFKGLTWPYLLREKSQSVFSLVSITFLDTLKYVSEESRDYLLSKII